MTKAEEKKLEKIKKEEEKLKLEYLRLDKMRAFEKQFENFVVAGIDEAGRGPLAGPVVAACVVLDKNNQILYLNDSKKLSEKKRNELYLEIKLKSIAYGIGIINHDIIDKINILEATHLAMKEAYENCDKMLFEKKNQHIQQILVDALKIKNINIPQTSIIKGDALSISIAAASIIAKVTRDDMMIEYSKTYPLYNFDKHKGYGTSDHIKLLKQYGPCDIHRRSFIKGFVNI